MIDASAPSLSPPDNGEGEGETIIEVAKLWKIFGRDPKRVLQPKYAESSKEETQEKTGCVLGLRDINIKIKKSEF